LEVLQLLMKKIIGTFAIYASLAIVAVASFANVSELKAQTPTPAQTPAAAQTTCTDEIKTSSYADFTKYRIPDAGKAYEAAKKYLAACPAEEGQIPTYLKKWTAQYDKDARKIKLTNLFVEQRKYADALPVAKEVLADDPDNPSALIALGYGGYAVAVNTKNESGNAEAINYAKKAIQVIEGGKAPESWAPFKSKDDTLGYLYYSIGWLERVSNPTDALANYIKAAQFDSALKKNPTTYAVIANVYVEQQAKQSADYDAKYKGKDKTDESRLAAENINQLVDRIIDALARAVALAGTDAASQQAKTQWMAQLTDLYKYRHNGTDAGLTDLIATALSKPLPPVPTTITTLPPEPAATATPTPGSGTSSTGSTIAPPATRTTTTAPAVSPTAATAPKTTTTTTATAPVATGKKTPVKPKTRNNHRRH
jgi:hypothetical protein